MEAMRQLWQDIPAWDVVWILVALAMAVEGIVAPDGWQIAAGLALAALQLQTFFAQSYKRMLEESLSTLERLAEAVQNARKSGDA